MPESRLFKPVRLGNLELKHRVAMAPLTRFRAEDNHDIMSIAAEYYAQRASTPGTFLISEATVIAKEHGGYPNVPGIYTQEHIDAWRKVTDAVHKNGSFIYQQLWALGRVANPQFAEANGYPVISASATQESDQLAVAKEMSVEDINNTVATYAQAAKNSIAAGFDGVEIHGANGYLIDQFLNPTTNTRTDTYGSTPSNRSRFAVEVARAVVDAVGANNVGFRLSPFSTFQGMQIPDPYPQFSDTIRQLNSLGLAYIHLIESRVSGNTDVDTYESLDPLLELWDGLVLLVGGYTPERAIQMVNEERKGRDVVVVFGRYFISTPDLVYRLREGLNFNEYVRSTFYDPKNEVGYADMPFSKEWIAATA